MEPDRDRLNACLDAWGIKTDGLAEKSLPDTDSPLRVLIGERDPQKFIAAFLMCVERRCSVFLVNPDWSEDWLGQAISLARPHKIFGEFSVDMARLNEREEVLVNDSHATRFAIMAPTGGSSGNLRFAVHTWDTLREAGNRFLKHFDETVYNSCCVLPLYHVSGLMQVMRALLSGGVLEFTSLRDVQSGIAAHFDPGDHYISLVPTQLKRLLENKFSRLWLSRFKTVLLGGAAADPSLMAEARDAKIRLALAYGMTETAALITALKPDAFLSGATGCGQPLPGCSIDIRPEQNCGSDLHRVGRIFIHAKSLFKGYYPQADRDLEDTFDTGDTGYFDDRGSLHITGRVDRVINTGGEKVNPERVEKILLTTGLVREAFVFGRADAEWGARVVAAYVPDREDINKDMIGGLIKEKLSACEMPKDWISLKTMPRNALGKIDFEKIIAAG